MPKIKFVAKKPPVYICDVLVPTDNDKEEIPNRENDPQFQLKIQGRYLTPSEKQQLLKSRSTHNFGDASKYESESTLDFENCARLSIEEMFGLEDHGIKTGEDVANCASHPLIDAVVKDWFHEIMGTKKVLNLDSDDSPEEAVRAGDSEDNAQCDEPGDNREGPE